MIGVPYVVEKYNKCMMELIVKIKMSIFITLKLTRKSGRGNLFLVELISAFRMLGLPTVKTTQDGVC